MEDRPSTTITLTIDEVWALSRAVSGTIARLLIQRQRVSLQDEEQHLIDFLLQVAPKVNEASKSFQNRLWPVE